MPTAQGLGPFSYEELNHNGDNNYALNAGSSSAPTTKFDSTNGETLEVYANGVLLEGDGSVANATDAGNKTPAHGFYVDSLTNPTKVHLVSNISGGQKVLIKRISNRYQAQVDFAPGSVIREQDLDDSTNQTLHVAQEAIDIALQGIVVDANDKWDGSSKVIKDVADGVADNDAVNVGQLETHDATIVGYKTTTLGYKEDTEDYKLEAADWAQKVDGEVKVYTDNTRTGGDLGHSAKAHASVVGTHAPSTGSAKEWATNAGSAEVDSGEGYSSKAYAQDTSASADTTGGSAKGWATTAHNTAVPGAASTARSALHYSTDAQNSATEAKNSATAVAQVYDNFSDVYLGSMRSDKSSADAVTLTGASWSKDSSSIAFTGTSSGSVTIGQELTSTGTGYPVGANIIGSQTTSPIVISNAFGVAGTGATLVFQGSGVYGAFNSTTGGPAANNDGDALISGNLYFNSQENEMRIYDGANWIAATSAGSTSLLEYKFVTTSTQVSNKTYSGTADVGGTLSYIQSNLIVFMNGVQLKDGTDYTATNGSSIVLTTAAVLNDEINVLAFKPFTTADMVSASNGGTFSSAVIHNGAVTHNGTVTLNEGITQSETTKNLSGTYSTEKLLLNDSYTLTGDINVTKHLALGTIADSDVVITNDSSARTITGSGTLEAGRLMNDPVTSLSGMTGELGTTVTGSPNLNLGNSSFPAGTILQVKHFPYYATLTISNIAASIPFIGSDSSNDYGCGITLSSSTNKVYVAVTLYSGHSNVAKNHQYGLYWNTSVGGTWNDAGVNDASTYWALIEHNTYSGVIHQTLCHSVNDIITPSSTTVWFKQQVWANTTGTSAYVGRSQDGNNSDGSSIILMEVQG